MLWEPVVIAIAASIAGGLSQESTIQTPYGFGEINAIPFVQPPIEERYADTYVLAPFECSSYYEPRRAYVKYKINDRFVYDCSFNGSDSSGDNGGDSE